MGIKDWFDLGKAASETAGAITSGITDVVVAAKGDIPPEAKAQLKILEEQGKQTIERLVQNSVEQARQFALKYEGTAEQIPKWLLLIRALIRPLITLLTFGWFGCFLSIDLYNILKATPEYTMILVTLPSGFWWILGIVMGFWFGGKVGERVAEKINTTKAAQPGEP